jgi:hypothetical protein
MHWGICPFPFLKGAEKTDKMNMSALFVSFRFPCPSLHYQSVYMEKGSNPRQPDQSDFRVMLHNIIRDGQNGFLSFEDVRAQ